MGWNSLNSYEGDFVDCIHSLEILDLPYTDCSFTWTNKREEGHFLARKLDRVMVNEDWLVEIDSTEVGFQDGGISDHSPAVVVVGEFQSFGPKPLLIMVFGLRKLVFYLECKKVGVQVWRAFLCFGCIRS
jgi:hypothetical protein